MKLDPTQHTIAGPRGPEGPRGLDGLSAYGVWLREGNSGTPEDFLTSLKMGGRFALTMHTGGQNVPPGQAVVMAPRVSRGIDCAQDGVRITKPGSFLLRYYTSTVQGTIAVYVNGLEAPATRFTADQGMLAVCCIEVAHAPADVKLVNVSDTTLELPGHSGAVDAYIHITTID